MPSLAPRLVHLRAPVVVAAFLAMSLLFAASCHNGDESTSVPTSYLFGAIHLGGSRGAALGGSPVRAVDADGVVVATTSVVSGGSFALAAPSWAGFSGRIEVDANVPVTTGGADLVHLAREVRIDASGQQSGFQWLGVPSTVVSRYVQRNPAIALSAAVEAVAAHLGIPTGVAGDTAFGETHRSPVRWSEVRAAAVASARSVDSFLDLLVEEVGTAPARDFRPAQPYPSLARWSGRGQQGAGPAVSTLGLGDAEGGGKAEWGRWVTDTRVMVDGFWMGWALKLTFNLLNGPPQPDPVLQEIQQVANDLAQLSTSLTANDVSVAWGYSAGLANQAVETIRAVQEQFLAYTQGQVRDPWLAASLLELRHLDLFYAVETLRQQLSGGPTAPYGPLPSIYARGKAIARFGVNPDSTADAVWLSMQVRDNEFLAEVEPVVDYYVGWGNLGLNLLAEWAHADPATFPSTTVGNTNNQVAKVAALMEYKLGSATQPGWNQSVKTAYQMIPPAAIGSDDVLVDCGGWSGIQSGSVGKMISKQIFRLDGANIAYGAPWVSYSTGPWPSYWIPLGLDDYRRLRQLAYAADPNNLTNGLIKLGFPFRDPNDLVFGFLDSSTGSGARKYDFTTDTVLGGQNYGEYDYYLYMRGAADDNGTIFATSKPYHLTATPAGMAASYNSTVSVVDLVNIQPYGQDPSAAFTIRDVLAWTTSAPSQVYPSNAPVPDPTDNYDLAPWTWAPAAPPIEPIVAVGQLATILTSSGASLGCMPAAVLSGAQEIQSSYETPVVASVQVTPYGQYLSSPLPQSTVNCFATGYVRSATSNRPIRLIDLTQPNANDPSAATNVVWSVTSPSGLAYFPPGSNVLHMNRLQGSEAMQITVTVTMPGGRILTDTQTCWTLFQ